MMKQFFIGTRDLSLLLMSSMVLLFSSCGSREEQISPPIDVDFLEIKATAATIEKKYPGQIEGSVNVDIKAQVSGYLDKIYVKEGDYVQKGQTLFSIKADVYNEQVQSSQAALKTALAMEETAFIELEKIKPLVSGQVVSDIQLKTAEASYASAKAQVAQARAVLGSSQINANFTLIKAPVSGYIGRIPNRVGNLITSSDTTPLTTLSEIDQVFVYFSLSEADYISFAKDLQSGEGSDIVKLVIADGSIYEHEGKLEAASGNIDATTGSISFKAVFPNPNKILRSGGTAKVILSKNIQSAVLIPMASVKDIQDKLFVFALADSNKVAMKTIEIKGNSGNNYILKSGLNNNEKIAINRIDELTEGVKVAPVISADIERK